MVTKNLGKRNGALKRGAFLQDQSIFMRLVNAEEKTLEALAGVIFTNVPRGDRPN